MPARIVVTDETLAQWRLWYERDLLSMADISKRAGIAKNTVRNRLMKAGVVFSVGAHLSVKAKGRPSARKGVTLPPEQIEAMRARATGNKWCVGRKHSPETLARISAGTKGKNVKFTPGQKREREAIRQASKRFVNRVLKATGRRKTIPSEKHLGYSQSELVAHLGPKPVGAHIDHYVPIVEFLRRGITDPAIINARPNLRWLDAHANQVKSASVPHDVDAVIALCRTTYTKGA